MFTTYSASAGSGKTTNLVADYLALCFTKDANHLQHNRTITYSDFFIYQQILAITFTNNASAEMKDRIVRTLNAFAFQNDEDFNSGTKAIYNMLIDKLFGANSPKPPLLTDFIRQESLGLLRAILYDYARFTLTTIDSFFQHVIRASALTFNLSINYAVQIELDEFYNKVIELLINELDVSNPLSDKILFLLNHRMEDTGILNIDNELRASLNLLYGDGEKNYIPLGILRNIQPNVYKSKIKEWRRTIKELPEKLQQLITPLAQQGEHCMSEMDFGSFYFPTFKNCFSKVQQDPMGVRFSSADNFMKEGSLVRTAKLSSEERQIVELNQKKIVEIYHQIAEIQKPLIKIYLDAKLLCQNADRLLVLFDLQQKMDQIKAENNFFILSEANTLIYENIKHEEVPALFENFKYHHFFIDEFQDTSVMQWQDLRPLLKNNAIDAEGGITLFGDVKQAIYRFRNGEVELFYNLVKNPDFIKKQFPSIPNNGYRNLPLSNNYRSLKSVVEFNNGFFEYYAEQVGFKDYYSDVNQNVMSKNLGLVRVFVSVNKDSKTEATVDSTGMPINPVYDQVLVAVKDALDRGYDYRDIAILAGGNNTCTALSDLLLKEKMNVVTAASLSLNSSPAINIIIHTLKYLLHPQDNLVKASILFYLLKLQNHRDSLSEILTSLKSNGDFEDIMKTRLGVEIPRNEWSSKNLFLLIKEIAHFYKLDEQADPFLVDFENMVLSYLSGKNGDIASFLTWWQQKSDAGTVPSLNLPSGLNAITISTIHKSKGLEYPVVILPYKSSSKTLKSQWVTIENDTLVGYVNLSASGCAGSSFESTVETEKKNMQFDELNLLYVAHTRAKECLYIITQKAKSNGSQYGDYLNTFMDNNEQSTPNNGGLVFCQDEEDPRLHYAGDRNWKKQNTDNKKNTETCYHLSVHTSLFNLEKVPVNYQHPSEQQEIGLFVHDYLSKLVTFPQNENDVEKMIATLPKERREKLREVLHRLMSDDTLKPYFSPEVSVMNEKSILDNDGREYRPDRIVFLKDKVMILDYKTGQDNPKYQEQINKYCTLLQQMGYNQVEGRLVFI